VKEESGAPFPRDLHAQLWGAIGAVFGSWMKSRRRLRRWRPTPSWPRRKSAASRPKNNSSATCAVPAAHGSFPTLSLRIFPWMLDPVPRRFTVCPHLFLPRCHRPSPSKEWVGFPHFVPRITTSRRSVFRGCRYSLMFRPPSLLSPQIVPTAATTTAEQPGILRPGLSCFVASARTGYANRPNTGN
jgi:hypothetical protein